MHQGLNGALADVPVKIFWVTNIKVEASFTFYCKSSVAKVDDWALRQHLHRYGKANRYVDVYVTKKSSNQETA